MGSLWFCLEFQAGAKDKKAGSQWLSPDHSGLIAIEAVSRNSAVIGGLAIVHLSQYT